MWYICLDCRRLEEVSHKKGNMGLYCHGFHESLFFQIFKFYRENANSITAIFIMAIFIMTIFQNFPEIFGLCIFSVNFFITTIFGPKIAVMKEIDQKLHQAKIWLMRNLAI